MAASFDQDCITDAWAFISDSYEAFSPARLHPFIDQGVQRAFAKFLNAADALAAHEGGHVLGYSAELATFPFPDEPHTLKKMRVKPPIPDDYYKKRAELRTKALELWKVLGDFIAVRCSKYADV